METMHVEPDEALRRLEIGNRRFVSNTRSLAAVRSQLERATHATGQAPFAVILTCADSRVPAEMVFDVGIGDIFVIRVAGNIVDPCLIGSIEYATAHLGTPLVVVMGHSSCGAVQAAIECVLGEEEAPSANIQSIIDCIAPAVRSVASQHDSAAPEAIFGDVVRENVRLTMKNLREQSPILDQQIRDKKVVVVGSEYSLVSGDVEFFERSGL